MTINAFYLIDKPEGITSFDVLRDLRKKLNMKKM
jgi:tRNA U55 pseudouridine synthase TruB